jgi:hypothetical protein
MTRFAAKRLAAVEIGGTSNQHEFNAGRLRNLLGFTEKTSGALTLLFYKSAEPLIIESEYTIYDAREGTSRTEWRLYYKANAIQDFAEADDLLILIRPDEHSFDLHAVIAPQNSQIEIELRNAFSIGDHETLRTFARVEPKTSPAQIALDLAAPIVEVGRSFGDLTKHPLVETAVTEGRMPSTTTMASAADALVAECYGASLNPDAWIDAALNAETALFEGIERGLGQKQLDELIDAGADYADVVAFALGKLQSRKTRRGTSLQNHFAALLDRSAVPYTAQCTTENKEKPDFIIPSCAAYHDPAFPADRLRMVGCKAKLRDRWRQYLAEAERIRVKHHLCLDPDLSDDVINNMHAQNLRTCMPKRIIEEAYAKRDVVRKLMTVEELISELRSASVG